MVNRTSINRCPWPSDDDRMILYHDHEWGVPVHDDTKLFEYMVLDAFQAGLSWKTVLHKRENFRNAFDNFDPEKVAAFDQRRIKKLLGDSGIIRNRLKIGSSVTNARSFLKIREKHGTFDKYIWKFTDGKTIHNKWRSLKELPPRSPVSDVMSKDLVQNGFKFVGSTICYAFMQAAGMVNDHMVSCYRYREIKNF